MAEQTWQQKHGVTPGKLALVGLLAVVLLGVIVTQWGGEPEPTVTAQPGRKPAPRPARRETRPTPANRGPARSANGAVAATRVVRAWPAMSVVEAARHDPFRPLAALRTGPPAMERLPQVVDGDPRRSAAGREAAEARGRAFKSLVAAGVSLVYSSGDEQIALIGDRTVRVGDVLEGYEVVDIQPEGITVEPAREPK